LTPTADLTNIPSHHLNAGETFYPTYSLAEDITYFIGNPIMVAPPKVYNIYYGNFSYSTGQQFIDLIDYFAKNLGGSSWWNMNTAYYQIISGIKTYSPNSLEWVKSINIAPTQNDGSLSQLDIVAAISKAITDGQIAADANAIYSFIFRGSIGVTVSTGQSWLRNWCGYHGQFVYGKNMILKFMVMGDPSSSGNANTCAMIVESSSANGHWGADAVASIYAHEATEVVTNYAGNAWMKYTHDRNFNYGWFENADLCEWDFGTYRVDPELNNANVMVGELSWFLQQNFVPNYGCRLDLPLY
jgi:hypothetical protein